MATPPAAATTSVPKTTLPAGPKPPRTAAIRHTSIDSDPDLHLTIGSPPSTRIGVSSKRLSEVSPVFKRMLNGPFSEGRVKRSPEQPQYIDLFGDNAQAMLNMCDLVYHKPGRLAKQALPIDRLYSLVKIADKYDCVDALDLQLRALMQKHFDKADKLDWKQSVLRAAATYLLRDGKCFKLATSYLIANFNQPFSGIRKLEGGGILSTSALLVMAEKRAKAQRKIGSSLGVPATCTDCGSSLEMHEYLGDLLETFDLDTWPPAFEPSEAHTVASLADCMKKVREIVCGDVCAHDDDGGRVDMLDFAQGLDAICKGLCVACVREDNVDLGEDRCTHET